MVTSGDAPAATTDRPPRRRRTALRWILVVVVTVLALAAWRILPVFTGPAIPSGATRLHIATGPPTFTSGCAAAALAPARVTSFGDDLVLITVDTGDIVSVVWPAGFGAWRLDGVAVLADPWGSVVGREGDMLDSLGGGTGADDDFIICPYGIVTGG